MVWAVSFGTMEFGSAIVWLVVRANFSCGAGLGDGISGGKECLTFLQPRARTGLFQHDDPVCLSSFWFFLN